MINKKYLKVAVFLTMFLISLFVVEQCAFAAAAAAGGDKIGVIDSQTVITKHPDFENAMKELQLISKKKEDEARAAADKEPDDAKKAQLIRGKRMELAQAEQQLMEPLIKQAQTAVRAVAKNKGLTVVLEKASVYVGGIDITEDVIQELLKKIISESPKPKK